MRFREDLKNNRYYGRYYLLIIASISIVFGIWLEKRGYIVFLKANIDYLFTPKTFSFLLQNNDLKTLTLNIDFNDLKTIGDIRVEALAKGILESESNQFVSAKIADGENSINCKIRLKGDLPDHWRGTMWNDSHKWSMRVQLKGDKLINGMKVFSLQDPARRMDLQEWLFLKNLSDEGCMHVRYDFVNLIINGKKMGIYAMEEHFSKEMIENNNRRTGVIVNYSDFNFWKQTHHNFSNIATPESDRPLVRNAKSVNKSIALRNQKDHAVNLLRLLQERKITGSEVFDTEKTGKFLAITHIWNAEHGLHIDDINFYFNPVSCKLEPVGFAAEPSSYPHFNFFRNGPSWLSHSLKDPVLSEIYLKYLELFSQKEYLDEFRTKYSSFVLKIRALLNAELLGEPGWRILFNQKNLHNYDPWESVLKSTNKIKEELNLNKQIIAYAIPEENAFCTRVFLKNNTLYPVKVKNISINGKELDPVSFISSSVPNDYFFIYQNKIVLHPAPLSEDLSNWVNLELHTTEKINDLNSTLTIQTNFLGNSLFSANTEVLVDSISFSNKVDPHRGLTFSDSGIGTQVNDNVIKVKEGEYTVNSSIYIPSGYKVVIDENVTIRFSNESVWVSESPIYCNGSYEKPITFTSLEDSWPGIFLNNVSDLSTFKNVNYSNVSGIGIGPNPFGIQKNGWTLTGGVTINQCLVFFENCTFTNFNTEDALNIISSNFILENCKFENVFSDAFDGDFVEGNITNCIFTEIGGDAIDFSGSNCSVSKTQIKNISDKGISVGENSRVSIIETEITETKFGVVSKDLSQTFVNDSNFSKYSISAFSAYQKKEAFGPASIEVFNCNTDSTEGEFLIQLNSSGRKENKLITGKSFDVKELYKRN